jgi:AcrR family transcriptional regulator
MAKFIKEFKHNKESNKRKLSGRLERVLDEAEELFIHEGFLHFSTDELARRLRCSKTTLYTIAPVRENFFEVVVSRRGAHFRQKMVAAMQRAPSVQEAITVGIDMCADNARSTSMLWQRDLGRFPAGKRALKQWKTDVSKVLEDLIERGIRENLLRKVNPRLAAELLIVSILQMSDSEFLADLNTTAAEAIRQIYTIFWSGLSRK